jgi:hypothetical protein
MRKESSIPVKTSILMTLKTSVLFLLTLATLTACANTRTVKIPQEYRGDESKIAIAPIEIAGSAVQVASTPGWGIFFGVTGVIVDDVVNRPKREALGKSINETLDDWRPEVVLRDKIAEELTKRRRIVIQEGEIVPLPENIRNSSLASLKWYNSDITVFDHSTFMNRCSPTAIMEVGFEGISIIGSRVITVILIKVVDPRTNNVIARRRELARLARVKSKINDSTQRQQYIAELRTNFDNAVTKAVPKMLDDIGL